MIEVLEKEKILKGYQFIDLFAEIGGFHYALQSFGAECVLVAQKIDNQARWLLKPMSYCLNYFGNGEVIISPRDTIKIGKITMQRQGGDGGRPTANMLPFKINPAELFSVN